LARGHRDAAERATEFGSARTAEACACAAQVAALDHRYDDARNLCEKAIELAGTSEDPALMAAVAAIAIEIEADRVEVAALVGPRGRAEVTEARGAADHLFE